MALGDDNKAKRRRGAQPSQPACSTSAFVCDSLVISALQCFGRQRQEEHPRSCAGSKQLFLPRLARLTLSTARQPSHARDDRGSVPTRYERPTTRPGEEAVSRRSGKRQVRGASRGRTSRAHFSSSFVTTRATRGGVKPHRRECERLSRSQEKTAHVCPRQRPVHAITSTKVLVHRYILIHRRGLAPTT